MNNLNQKKATIKDVAELAEVSKTTISRYLNGQYEYMSIETKERIAKAIKKLNYRPSNIARSLKSKKTGVIGCIIADIGSQFSSIVVKGINDVCKDMGYDVLFANTDNNSDREKDSIISLMDNKVDGLIINTTGKIDDYLIDLSENGINIVLVDRCLKEINKIDTVTTDNYKATYKCMEFLFNQGYKKIAFFTQDLTDNSSRYFRYDAYIDAAKNFYEIDGNKYTYVIDNNNIDTFEKKLIDFRKECNGEEGVIFAVNGVILLNVLHAMKNLNIKIKDDLGVCGYDDWGWASLITPGITTITQNSYDCGVQSAKLLIDRINKKDNSGTKFIEIPSELIIRGSTNPK
ncbi:LacI family DNA-binding transcriptional regulator [Clostridium sp. AL.422]|uniref:LacI family DNA-binding transcriptional regulator n=1 Tax=Clostridium TaxID=1485 RepID=UPI00293DC1C7|nr:MULTISPECIES: LacI family DNA-binding transcriptional regulator [unclassified Clostridium]MDV4151562.1 LacI family DNA-binding transcriptional regulator [Clostridium sp. AL.422]